MLTKDDGGNIFYPSEFLGDSLIKTAINQIAWVEYVHTGQAELGILKVQVYP